MVNSFIVSRFDYCNSILAGLQTCQPDRNQSVLNTPLPIPYNYGRTPSDHTTDLLCDNLRIHWLRVPQRIACKLCLITYNPVSTGILPHSLPEWAFRARPGLWRNCLCPKVARIAEQKFANR